MSTSRLEKIKLRTSDGAELHVDRKVAERSVVLKHLIEDIGEEGVADQPVPLSNVSGPRCRVVCPFALALTYDP